MEFFKANIIPSEVLVQTIAFLVVFWILKRFAWKPILSSLEARRTKIEEEFSRIENAKKEIESLKKDYLSHLQNIEEEGRAKIQAAIEEGHHIAREIQNNARQASQERLEKTKGDIQLEIEKARIALRHEIADLALRVSEKIINEEMTEEKHQDKILKIIEEIERNT
ncbi:MAG: F0F1 ATP synthase subunit B [Candidatus Omnitrophica bacterium]|nr:F0F1 ATP synthase subunit B [Candidatus Omnitrophota bacterium]